jgi:hypothetical protein
MNQVLTITTASFTQPNVGSTVSVSVVSAASLSTGLALFVSGGGYYSVSGITNSTTLVLQNLGLPGNASPSASVSSGALVGSISTLDESGNQIIVGAGVAGTPAGGVVSVQGVSGGEPLAVTGTVSVSGGTSPALYNNYTSTSLSGTFGVTNGSGTVSTSSSQVGVLGTDDLVTFGSQPNSYYKLGGNPGAGNFPLSAAYNGSSNASTSASAATFADKEVVKNSAGSVLSVQVWDQRGVIGGAGTFMLFDSASLPSTGDTPKVMLPTDNLRITGTDLFTVNGVEFLNGITFAFSSQSVRYSPTTMRATIVPMVVVAYL